MRFLVDAQLPARLALWLRKVGFDAMHSSDLPDGNRSTDADIAKIADADDRVVVSKDADFLLSHVVSGSPQRLLVVATGNIRNDELIALFDELMGTIASRLRQYAVVELHPGFLRVHDQELRRAAGRPVSPADYLQAISESPLDPDDAVRLLNERGDFDGSEEPWEPS
ncbi:hypothetical protein DY023_04365 [Microbacterium bovistercoris]|uniref:DUF5615 domain-containing protein n=1 Tax=Microbacterium bovistercoris TaxID=2293570 RepID=A0A371NWB0_9MICO|nr:DUF5615 family PIN-like protein [Microbacterium bovistercoris]REJ07230.1 hypothetical protein DY023_04365 [Microbacterium bovistercoris]